jgi:bifunctional non-homologous end joining protein LigD
VQKHDATRLHYDFRLELDGVLLSWAVPKGPSLNPTEKRLSMHVEDHPFDYRKFEGTIPEGNYGAGEVIVWDEGTYHAVGSQNRRESEELMRKGMQKGHLSFILDGHKLKGEFSLVKFTNEDDRDEWLLIKKKDQFATTAPVTDQDLSVLSNKPLRPRVKKKALFPLQTTAAPDSA